MSGGPPRWLELAVTPLVPPVAREEVLGDLWERYRSPWRYLADVARAVPWLATSQALRSTDPALFMLLGFILFASFGGLEPQRALLTAPIALPALPAAACGLAALVLRNAYRREDLWTWHRAMGDVASLAAAILVSQALVTLGDAIGLIAPSWRLPLGWAIGGLIFSALAILLLRADAELANTGLRPATLDHDEEVALIRRNLRLRASMQTMALAALALVAVWFSLGARLIVAIVAGTLALCTAALIVRGYIERREGNADCLAELERQRDGRAVACWWIAAPLLAGLAYNVIAFGVATRAPVVVLLGSGASVTLIVLVAQMTGSRRRRLSAKLTLLRQDQAPPSV